MSKTTTEINNNWTNYDKKVAKCHLYNYGKIYLDEFGFPIDNEYEIADAMMEGSVEDET